MFRFIRAAGFAAAIPVAVFGAIYAGPSRAWEVDSTATFTIDQAPVAAARQPLGIGAAPPIADHAGAPPRPVDPERESSPNRSLVQLVSDLSSDATADAEHECLAGAVYFEAKGESLQGQLSVADVVLNRTLSGRFPRSACGVVKQRGQFSFVRGGRFPAIARGSAAWRKAVAIARIAREDLADSPAGRALFFHARRVSPGWRGLTRVAAVGNHVFYR